MSENSTPGAATSSPSCEPELREFVHAKGYAALCRAATPAAMFLRRRLKHLFVRLQAVPSGRLLDIGCGPGVLLNGLDDNRFERHGVDCSPAMIRQARNAAGKAKRYLSIARLEHLPYPDHAFDVILALGVLEYVR